MISLQPKLGLLVSTKINPGFGVGIYWFCLNLRRYAYDVFFYCYRSDLFPFHNNTITELHDRHSLKKLHLPLPFLTASGLLKNKSLPEGKSL